MFAVLNIFLTKMALRLFEISIVLSLCVFIRHLSAQVVHTFGIHLVLEHSLKASDTLYIRNVVIFTGVKLGHTKNQLLSVLDIVLLSFSVHEMR